MMAVIVIAAMLAVGFFNGANDVSKSVATLVGSGVTRYRVAIVWGSVWTFAGAAATASIIFASRFALPVSTTHVSSAAIIGLGLKRNARAIRWKTVGERVLAWIMTLPVAAAIPALAYFLLRFTTQ